MLKIKIYYFGYSAGQTSARDPILGVFITPEDPFLFLLPASQTFGFPRGAKLYFTLVKKKK